MKEKRSEQHQLWATAVSERFARIQVAHEKLIEVITEPLWSQAFTEVFDLCPDVTIKEAVKEIIRRTNDADFEVDSEEVLILWVILLNSRKIK